MIVARIEGPGGTSEIEGSDLLLAIGRIPNTDDLGLDKAGVHVDPRGYIVTDELLRTSAPNIWALGDCNGRGAFTHTSYNDYEIVAANLLDNATRRVTDRILTYGLLHRSAARPDRHDRARRAHCRSPAPHRAAADDTGRTCGRKGRDAGVHENPGRRRDAEDPRRRHPRHRRRRGVHCLTDTMYAGAPYTTLAHAVHIHPTVSELIPTVLGNWRRGNCAAQECPSFRGGA